MDKEEIFDKVKGLLSELLSVDKEDINLEKKLQDDLGVDSLDLIDLLSSLEEEFDLEIDMDSADDSLSLFTVGDVVDYIHNHLGNAV